MPRTWLDICHIVYKLSGTHSFDLYKCIMKLKLCITVQKPSIKSWVEFRIRSASLLSKLTKLPRNAFISNKLQAAKQAYTYTGLGTITGKVDLTILFGPSNKSISEQQNLPPRSPSGPHQAPSTFHGSMVDHEMARLTRIIFLPVVYCSRST